MYIARMGQLMRTDTSLLYGLRDEGIDPGELCIAQLDIYTAQNVDGIRNRFPVERRILGNVKTQVLIQRLNCLLRTALCVSGVDLIIRVFIVDIQITVPEYRYKADLTRLQIDIGNHVDIRVRTFSDIHLPVLTSRIDTEARYGHVALHIIDLFLGQVDVLNLVLVEINLLHRTEGSVIHIPERTAQNHQYNHDNLRCNDHMLSVTRRFTVMAAASSRTLFSTSSALRTAVAGTY